MYSESVHPVIMLSTRGKCQPPLKSLFKTQANSGHQADSHKGAETKICEAKTETGS